MTRTIAIAALIVGVWACRICADVADFQVVARSQITQSRSGEVVQTEQLARQYPATQTQTPVEALTEMSQSDAGATLWSAYNRVLSNDPQYNSAVPTDFVLETAAGSADPEVSLALSSTASQTRTINVLESEFPTFPTDSPLNLQSSFLLDGGLAAVIPNTAGSAAGLEMVFGLNLAKNGTDLWSGTVSLVGAADGSVTTATSGSFHANDFEVSPIAMGDLATVYLLEFDDADIPFDYLASVGETFDLEAEITLDMAIPGGLGGGAAFGTVPTELVMMTQDLFSTAASSAAAAAPEPATLLLLVAGAVAGLIRRR